MPSVDRHWRLNRWIGLGLVLFGAGVPVGFFIALIPIDGALSAVLADMDWSMVWLCATFAAMGIALIASARKGMARQQLREQALAGDEQAMPLVAIKPPMTGQAEAAHEPLELLWRTNQSPWMAVGALLLLLALITAAVLAVIVVSMGPWLEVGGVVLVAGIGAGVWWWSWRPQGPTGVVATELGLRRVHAGKDRAFIPWGEARLFEFWRWSVGSQESGGYALSNGRTLIEWIDHPPDKAPVAADDASYEEMWRRQQTLIRTIIARTGLTPRACKPELAQQEGTDSAAQPRTLTSRLNVLAGSAVLLFLAGSPLVAAVGALAAPLTTSLLVDIYVAVTLGPLGLVMLVTIAWGIVSVIRNAPPPDVPRPHVKLPPAPPGGGESLSIRAAHVWRDRGIGLIISLLVAGDIYALVRGFIDLVGATDPNLTWSNLQFVTIIAMSVPLLLLSMVAVGVSFERETRTVTDERGVRWQRGRRVIAIPWDMVVELIIQVEKGKVASFKIIASDALRTEIAWPVEVILSGATPAPGESPGAVFAAAVAQRAGVTPRVEYE